MTDRMHEDRFIARVADVLREPEVLDAEFERRVMASVSAEAMPWWSRSRSFTVTPLRMLALAAAFAGFMVLGTVGLSRSVAMGGQAAPVAAAAVPDTVFLVRFVLAAPTAQRVSLVGDFNGWARGATQLEPSGEEGVWSAAVPLSAGRHEYAFVVDGEHWVADPSALRTRDEFGTESSVIRVGSARPSDA
jgi:hypothetical protein